MKKRITALAVSCAMMLSSASALAASGFSDLNEFHAWAEPQIEHMTTLGIIKGYTDGTFRPDRSITKTEAVVLMARVAGYITEKYDIFKSTAYTRYHSVVSKYDTPYPNEAAYLLYKGVLTEDELGGYLSADRAGAPLLRYEMAILLTRLMRMEDTLKSTNHSLSYDDRGTIPYHAVPYVEYVTNASLMQGVYDPENPDVINFNPYGSVTRAQITVLLYRVMEKFDISVEYYSVLGKNASNNTITYRTNEGTTVVFPVKEDVNLIIDGYNAPDVAPIATGAHMAMFYINDELCDIEIANDSASRWNGVVKEKETPIPTDPVEGTMSKIILSEECSVVINDTEYALSAACGIYVNHKASTVYDLRVGYKTKLEFANGKVITLYSTAPSDSDITTITTEGKIQKVNLTNRQIHLAVENSETGVTSEKALIVQTGASISNAISGQSVEFMDLNADDYVVVTGIIKEDGNFYASKIVVK